MNKRKLIGLVCVLAGLTMVGGILAQGEVLSAAVGKAVWYLPYVALVKGVTSLLRV